MKNVKGQVTENSFEGLSFEVLTTNEMSEVCGGSRPKSRDKDIYDYDEDL